MPITFRCPACGHKLRACDHASGKHAKCKCGQTVTVPEPSQAISRPSCPPAKECSEEAFAPPEPQSKPEFAVSHSATATNRPQMAFSTKNIGTNRRKLFWLIAPILTVPLLILLLAVNVLPLLNANRQHRSIATTVPQVPTKEPTKQIWHPWKEEKEFAESDKQNPQFLSPDYLPLEGPFRFRVRAFFDKNGNEDMLVQQECSFAGSGVVHVQTLLTVTKSLRMDGRNLHRLQEERYQIENGFVSHGQKVFKDNQLTEEVWYWERTLKIGAKQGDSWLADPTDKDQLRTLAAFGTYHGKPSAVISVGDYGFYILVSGYGEIERKHFREDKRLSFRVSCR